MLMPLFAINILSLLLYGTNSPTPIVQIVHQNKMGANVAKRDQRTCDVITEEVSCLGVPIECHHPMPLICQESPEWKPKSTRHLTRVRQRSEAGVYKADNGGDES